MKPKRALRCVFLGVLFLLASVLVVDTVFADVPVINSVRPWTRATDSHLVLNITVTHRNYYTGHYVDRVQVDINGTVDTVSLSPPQLVTFVVQYDVGVVSSLTARAMAHCTVHGSSSWSLPVQVGGSDGGNGGDGGDGGNGGTFGGGLFNLTAPLYADLALVLQIVVYLVFLAGFVLVKTRRNYARHGAIMSVAIVLHTISILMVMVPSLLSSGGLFENLLGNLQLAILAHATLGTLVEILGLYVVLAWALHYKDVKPCFRRKTTMRVLAVLWTIAIVLGVYVYILLYVPV
jgi:uncharacterized membrane protein YozB (DUF420 family)